MDLKFKIKYWIEVVVYGSLYVHALVGALLFTTLYAWGVIDNMSRLTEGFNAFVGTFWCAGWGAICALMLNMLLSVTPQLAKIIVDNPRRAQPDTWRNP